MKPKEKILFFDIETACEYKSYEDFYNNSKKARIFKEKYSDRIASYNDESSGLEELYLNKAPLIPSYGIIVCISLGYYYGGKLKIKTYTGDEKEILENALQGFKAANKEQFALSGYNIRWFDIPWLNFKLLKYNIKIPPILRCFDKKPWELKIFDIYDEMKVKNVSLIEMMYELYGEYRDDFGSQVNMVYWNGNISEIKRHCELDVEYCSKIYERIYGLWY